MTPKEKALKLIHRMGQVPFNHNTSVAFDFNLAKQFALVAVDFLIEDEAMHTNGEVSPVRFWTKVKEEINKTEL